MAPDNMTAYVLWSGLPDSEDRLEQLLQRKCVLTSAQLLLSQQCAVCCVAISLCSPLQGWAAAHGAVPAAAHEVRTSTAAAALHACMRLRLTRTATRAAVIAEPVLQRCSVPQAWAPCRRVPRLEFRRNQLTPEQQALEDEFERLKQDD